MALEKLYDNGMRRQRLWFIGAILLIFLENYLTSANDFGAYVNFIHPRRRSSADGVSSQMQSRAVDTRIPLEIHENEPRGTVVGYIPTKVGFTYRFNEPPREFVLDANTGEIKTNTVLDREQRDRYDLVVLSSQPTYPIEVRINVVDTNDNHPEFPDASIAVSISENSEPGTRLLLDAATDKDIGTNGISDDYRIVSGNHDNKFRLAVTKNPSGDVTYLHLETTGKLDRETRGIYTLNISARDDAKPPKFGYVQVNVTVLDVNDSPPIFDHSDYIVSLNESVVPGTSVLQVMASDNDLGDNAKITYYLSEGEAQFTVDPETGVISTTEKLSCPHQQTCPTSATSKSGMSCPKSCVFTVFARDHGSPRQDGRTYVTINLIDTNDHDPIIRFQYFPLTSAFATVDENAANDSVVAAIYVVDMDEGLNGDTNIKILSGNEMQHFRLENTPSFDIVRVNGILDREEISTYNLTIIATDKGTPPRTATAHLIINVNDVNDAYPVFEKSEYSAVLSELVPIGTYVVSIHATDEDTGVNAQIYYDFVSGNARQWFRIDPVSGLITTQANLDRELQGTIQLNISARDGGPNPKRSYAELKVIILDENDQAPKFMRNNINVTLSENAAPNTLIAMLTAIDNDQGTNGSVTYSLYSTVEQKYPNTFLLDSMTGQLTTKTELDREKIDSYEIYIVAKDQGAPQQSSTATVSLLVEDVNDNHPRFYPKQYFIAVPEETGIGTVVGKVWATDSDIGDNALIAYSLENDNDGLFTIDARNGAIKLRSSLHNSHKPLYRLTVSARDRDNTHSDDAQVVIIRESKLEELEFDSIAGYEFQIIEDFGFVNAKVGREVGKVQIVGKAKGAGNRIEYSIVNGDTNGNFGIDPHNGNVRTVKLIDREEAPFYSLNIVAWSGLAYAKTTVNISILDLNDCAPVFLKEYDELRLYENAAVGQEVYMSRARDKDSGTNSRITYSLAYNPDEQFRISEASGVLYLNRPIRADPETTTTIEIVAKDGGLVPLSAKSIVTIRFDDVNDHTPVFDHTSYETSLLESTGVNTRFFALAATDVDLNANGRISYTIVDGNTDEKFGIFPDGYMYVKKSLDREEHDYYSLTVMATDHGNPPRSSSVPVVIHIIDENDNAPQFTNSTFTFSINENDPIDSFVGKLTATDRDIGRNAELIYTLSSNQNDFIVDPRNGFIKTAKVFDREALVQSTGQHFISLEATVSDNGHVRLTDTVKIKIFILDLNDNEPKFLRAPYKVQITEAASIGAQLIRIYTVDIDDGLNGDVFYHISDGNSDGKFSIDGSTGQIILAKALDRETKDAYKLSVIAHDAAVENRLSANTTIIIDVLDENDNEPTFTQTNTQIAVNETTPVETELIQFRASDSDLGMNSQITFSITAGNRRDTFHIDPITGKLFLHRPLDYEETTSYTLNITATDNGSQPLQSSIHFNIIVVDENDNPPNFPTTAIVRQIKEGIPRNTPIVTITAEDPDSGINGKIVYTLINQEPSNNNRHFSINPASGVISTIRDIDRETIDTFKLTILATDQALPASKRLSAEKICTVIVEDINDSVPMFVSMNAAILPQNKLRLTRNGVNVMKVFARDADSGTNGLVTYEMVGGSMDLFKLHRSTGAITLQKPIDSAKVALKYQLAVKATDEAVQSDRKSSDAYVTIITLGDHANKPIFEKSELFGSVYENEPIGTNILTVCANLQNAAIEYYVTNVTGNGRQVDRLFDIDAKSGVISTAAELDREAGVDTYEIEVYAIAMGGKPRTASAKVKINVLDKNDSPPVFLDEPITFTVSEDFSPGQIIGTIKATDPDKLGSLHFELVDGNDKHFELDKISGTLKLIDVLDRETTDLYRLNVRVSDGVQNTDSTVSVQVTDANDNPPTFTHSSYSFEVPENAPRGYQVGIVNAFDADVGNNAVVTYTVISDWGNDVFTLNPQTGVFTLTARLDYEDVQNYIFVVQAQDNGHPSLSATATVYCNVLDLNDNAPIFDPMSYSNELFENIAIGKEVVSVSATDIDAGHNGKIEYMITAGDDNNDFTIMTNGSIVTKHALDRETIPMYSLTITARDCAIEPEKRLSSTVQVTIHLKDVNDMSPEFVTSNETKVMENTAINTVIMAVKAIDKDEGRNGYMEYELESEPFLPFTLGPVDGLLRVSGRLDREIRSMYEVKVTARDRGEPSMSTSTNIKIKILDENDNSPVFDPRQYSASVAENASIGTMVLKVSATDIDEGSNGRIRFAVLSGDENQDFIISEDSGVVRVAKNLDYERKSRYVLLIQAEDCANDICEGEPHSDTAELIITITDINDSNPIFLDSPYLIHVMENVIPPNGGYISTVTAYDADTPPYNSQVRYFLKEGDADLFHINASTGDISLLRSLDRESQAEYILTLIAMDTGSPPLTGTGTVQVKVEDMNDEVPKFERQNYYAAIMENSPIGAHLLQVKAKDNDVGLNAKVRYSLSGDKADTFRIDQNTGEITTATILDRETISVYSITLMAQDSSTTEPKATAVNLTIIVNDENDNSPTFKQTSFIINVPDHIKSGQFVFGAHAIDLDEAANGRVVYAISGKDAVKFTIDSNSGVIKTVDDLSTNGFGLDKVYSLVITASDQGKEMRRSNADLTILLRPSHLFPTFSYLPQTQFILPEDTAEGKLVTKLRATSPKKGPSGIIKYAIAGGNVLDALNIDAETGELTIGKVGLDYETSHIYEVWVEAADNDHPSLRAVFKILLNVTDENDNAPIMNQFIYRSEVLEEETPPILVTSISANDADSGDNGLVTYKLITDHDGSFEINADSGEIFTSIKLDRETSANYELIVEAVDQGVPQRTGTASVLVTVLDKNDNPPRFSRLFSVNVTENAEIGTFVIKVTSTDLDVGENANVKYSFTENAGNKFAIDSISGDVTVRDHLDREQQDEYVLKVAAFDGAWRAETALTITIQDLNDNAPEFEHSYYSFNFLELQPNISYIGQIIATDRDKQGPNSIISYSLQQPSDLFSIDPATGEIFSKRTLHYRHSHLVISPENMYSVIILAIDNGKPPMYSECFVNINIVDSNNNAPKFEQTHYLSPVLNDANIGEDIVQVTAKDIFDSGINAEVEYFIIGGNGSDYFAIDKTDGWISLRNRLANEPGTHYKLVIRAADRGIPVQEDETEVKIIITGENRYSPVFTSISYQVIVPENEPIGSAILTVTATDDDIDDPNAMIRYSISSGNERKEFAVEPVSGAITILQSLDYDTIQEYHLNITARDLGFKSKAAVAMLTITLTDINDHAPEFSQSVYQAFIPENSPINTFVFRAMATDKDSPRNAIIHYSIMRGMHSNLFNIIQATGEIVSKSSFDYEQEREYQFTIKAMNPDSPMSSTATVIVHVTGVNEYYPSFLQPVFHFDVSESAEIGTVVGSIQATDRDFGDDGKVYYLLVGSSNDKGFNINSETGMIRVSRNLDRETQSRVVLTVMAKNFGSIHGNDTDEAQVIVSIQDGNDPPEFLQPRYEASVAEDVPIGRRVIGVEAIDKDVRIQNNQFSYSIIGGNVDQTFKIDPRSGYIETMKMLDRETIPKYSLLIGAIDTGIPPQTGTTTVAISITDVNDNGPVLDDHNKNGQVYENEPTGTIIMTLSARDADLPPNGGPFTYYLLSDDHKSFVTIDKSSGLVKTTKNLDRESTPQFDITVEIEDNGSPRMRSQQKITIHVLDQNDMQSSSRTARILVQAFNHRIPIGKIAVVKPNDLDTSGDYRCRFLDDNNVPNGMTIRNGCDLYTTTATSTRSYSYSMYGNDGRHSDVLSSFTIDYASFDNQTIEHSVTVRVSNMTAEQFLAIFYQNFLDVIKSSLDSNDMVNLYGMRNSNDSLDLFVAVKNTAYGYQTSAYTIKRFSSKEDALKQLFQTKTVTIGYSPCNENVCKNAAICSEQIQVHKDIITIDSQNMIFTSAMVVHDFMCKCSNSYTGQQCDKPQNPCAPNPCQSGGQCRRQGYDVQCICPPHREGKLCHLDKSDVCGSSPCKNGGSCRESPDGSSYFCLCRPGYRGIQCDDQSDPCRPNPCSNQGQCIKDNTGYPGYKCSCVNGRYGVHCERATFGFPELSYMVFPSLDAASNDISIIFATTKPNALLAYNFGAQTGGRSDFIAIEVVRGKAVFSFGGSRTAITSLKMSNFNEDISNGQWHKITAIRNGRVMSLSIAKCTDQGDSCEECRPHDSTCYVDEIGPTGTLNFNKQPLYIGGLSSADPILERPGQVHSDDFVGCVHSIAINGRTLNLSNPLKSGGILSTCDRKASSCSRPSPQNPATTVCGAFSECSDRFHYSLCRCGGNLLSPDCQNSLDSISLGKGGFVEFIISEKYRRMQLLDNFYVGSDSWTNNFEKFDRYVESNATLNAVDYPKSMSMLFRTLRTDGLIFYAATNKHYTIIQLKNGRMLYQSRQSNYINMTINDSNSLSDGKWHNITLHSYNRILKIFVDDKRYGDELDASNVHDFLDPYLTIFSIGGARKELLTDNYVPNGFEGCFANFTINDEIQPFNGSGTVFKEILSHGRVFQHCHITGIGSAQSTDPLSIGISLVIVFFVILLVAITASFIIFRLRKQYKEKMDGPNILQNKHSGASTLLVGSGLLSQGNDNLIGRGLHSSDVSVGFHGENADIIRPHHMAAPELISKKYKERDIHSNEHRPQRPDIIEREVISKSPLLRDESANDCNINTGPSHTMPSMSNHPHEHHDLGSEFPEHYDLENASSIAPSDIDIVYHYKGYREANNVRKYKVTPPPVSSYSHHKHNAAQQQLHRHSPHHASPFPRIPPQAGQSVGNGTRHQSTPLARLSPSSELSSQRPRILTLHDISGKPLQGLLATTSSSGGVGKDALHSNSERSLNSPVMSSGQSSSASRSKPVPPQQSTMKAVNSVSLGLTAEEIQRLNNCAHTSSLVSSFDAVSNGSEIPRGGNAHHLSHLHHGNHSANVDAHSSTSSDESEANDSFTCSEIEYDNASLNGDKYSKSCEEKMPPPSYDGFESSFRGSLSTLVASVASDDELSNHIGNIYRPQNANSQLGWDYLLNWGLNFEKLMGVFNDIAELPDTMNNGPSIPSEEYV